LNREHVRGMGRCLWELLTRARHLGVEWHLLADRPDLPLHLPKELDAAVDLFECRGYRFRTWEQLALPRRASRLHSTLLHCPASPLPWWQPIPTVLTLHDVIPWRGDEPGWPRGWYVDWLLPRAFHRSAAVITPSESSRRDILRLWPRLADRLFVVPLGVED